MSIPNFNPFQRVMDIIDQAKQQASGVNVPNLSGLVTQPTFNNSPHLRQQLLDRMQAPALPSLQDRLASIAAGTDQKTLATPVTAMPMQRTPLKQPMQMTPNRMPEYPDANTIFARRALVAKQAGMTPADSRFAPLTEAILAGRAKLPAAKMSTVTVPQTTTTTQVPAQLSTPGMDSKMIDSFHVAHAAPAGPTQGTLMTMHTPQKGGQQIPGVTNVDDSWLDNASVDFLNNAIKDPKSTAAVVLKQNGYSADSTFGQYFMDMAYTMPSMYEQQAAAQPGLLAANGTDYATFVQGMLEHLVGPANESQDVTKQLSQNAGAQVQAYFNDPTSDIAISADTEANAAGTQGSAFNTPAEALFTNVFYPALQAQGRDAYAKTAKAVLDKHYQDYHQLQLTDSYGGTFSDYLRTRTDFAHYFQ